MKRGVGRIVLWLTVTAAGLAQAAPPADAEVWITIGADAVTSARAALRAKGAELPAPVRTRGGVAVMRVRASQLEALSLQMHEAFKRCGGFVAHESQAAALQVLDGAAAPAAPSPVFTAPLDNGDTVRALIAGLEESQVRRTITTLSSYRTRNYLTQEGADAALWLKGEWEAWAQGRSDVSVSLYSHLGWPQPSVILTLQGTTLPDEVVVIGGHLDSFALPGKEIDAPGADDNASGIASFSEVLRVALAQGYRPQRTVKFMAYAAEEGGLRGSREIANAHRAAGANVVGVLQLDMTNFRGSTVDVGLITDSTSAAQNAFLTRLLGAYLPGITWRNTTCGYGCSDHVPWHNAGYAASMPFESLFGHYNPTIHTVNDTLARSRGDVRHALKFSRIAAAYLAELAKGTVGAGASPQGRRAN